MRYNENLSTRTQYPPAHKIALSNALGYDINLTLKAQIYYHFILVLCVNIRIIAQYLQPIPLLHSFHTILTYSTLCLRAIMNFRLLTDFISLTQVDLYSPN